MCGSGAESGAEGWGGADVADLGSDFEDALRGAAEVVVPLAQATVLTTAMVSSAEEILNHRGHRGAQGTARTTFIFVERLFMVFPVIPCALCG